MTRRSAGDAVVETLLAWGLRHVFICPGSTEAAFLDATLDHPDLEVVLTPHEAIAVSAADGYARATGDPAVAYLHTPLGLANGLGHLDAARLARSPVVVLTELKPAAIQAHEGFTSIPSTGRLAEPFVKWQWQSLTAAGRGPDAGAAPGDHRAHRPDLARALPGPDGPGVPGAADRALWKPAGSPRRARSWQGAPPWARVLPLPPWTRAQAGSPATARTRAPA